MRVANNISALHAWRHFTGVMSQQERAMTKLSSGLRVAMAGDDPAGLSISESMRAQIRGSFQAMRNIQDGIQLVHVAESALGEVAAILQRGRELSLQAANGVLTDEQREHLQAETDALLGEIDRIADSTEFNKRKLLGGGSGHVAALVDSLRRSWLTNAEALVTAQYGLQADDVPIKIVADTTGPRPAYVIGQDDGSGKLINLELHINLSMIQNMALPDGGAYPQYADRVVGHEMVHAVMARTMNFAALPNWFQEGAAEFLIGADERLAGDLAAAGSVGAFVNEIDAFTGTSPDYSVGYAAVKYLHQQATGGMSAVMARLAAGDTLDQAIQTTTGGLCASTAAFVADFKAAAGGQAFIAGLNLADADVGAIGGGTAESVVPDTDSYSANPLLHFAEVWPETGTPPQAAVELQVSPTDDGGVQINLPKMEAGTYALGLIGIDLVSGSLGALAMFDGAIAKVSTLRSHLGAIENRLEHTYTSNAVAAENLQAAESRIRDADMAHEMSGLTKLQIVTQAFQATLAQASVAHRDAIRTLIGQ